MSAFLAAATSVALVLSGGGARGAYQIGVWKALRELNIDIVAVYGTSVGAINGALIAYGDYDFAEKAWLEVEFEDVMNVPEEMKKVLSGGIFELNIFKAFEVASDLIESGGIDVTPLREKLKALLPEEKIRSSKVHYGLVTYCVSDLKPFMLYIEEIPEGMLADYILSSANFPLFKREEIAGKLFIDGGIYSNVPVRMAVERGWENILVVDIGTIGLTDILDYLRIFRERSRIGYIRPREHFGNVLNFDREVVKKYFIEGYLDTLAYFGKLYGEQYYLSSDEDVLKQLYVKLDAKERDIAGFLLGLKLPGELSAEQQYESFILPRLRLETLSFFDEPKKVAIKLLETLARLLNVERLKIYTPLELIEAIVHGTEPENLFNRLAIQIVYRKLLDFVIFVYKNAIRKM
ncbi:MAG: patatin-like phospholipase family protein [Pseudothermotoga sp.]|uniref:patatin-like phospholipase family protein n=1 Tax=Pseudothermotoga sp. TaxID=2033661 RepID=UPI0019BBA733|nr:patatin-like phospholipase family protein [Pseudothermotoga sp.]MBC7122386.1 patatin-like phospholipase family protein [Pseudothermotoga sp.]